MFGMENEKTQTKVAGGRNNGVLNEIVAILSSATWTERRPGWRWFSYRLERIDAGQKKEDGVNEREVLYLNHIWSFIKKGKTKKTEISVSQYRIFFLQTGMIAGNTFLSNGMRVNYSDISQTFFKSFMLQL